MANGEQIELDAREICRYLGYANEVQPSPRIASVIEKYIRRARRLIKPAYSYVIRDIKEVDGSQVLIEDSVVFESQAIARLLEKCEKVAVFVLTIGAQLEDTVGALADKGQIVDAYILDAIGSSATEKLADLVQNRMEDMAHEKGLCTSRRFSPGYCDWNIVQQRSVFRLLRRELTGVHLTRGCLMIPQKSVSGIIGVGSCDGGVESYNPCITCNKRICPGRR